MILTGVDAAKGGADAAGVVDGTSGQCAGDGHGADERGRDVAQAQRQHLLRSVYTLALRCNVRPVIQQTVKSNRLPKEENFYFELL